VRCLCCRLVMIMCIFSSVCIRVAFVFELISLLKCNSARRLFLAFPGLKGTFWKGHLWYRGKFYCSIGQVNGETIKHYIEKSKHQ
jgi:REP element-mobilizing transposase RayT